MIRRFLLREWAWFWHSEEMSGERLIRWVHTWMERL